MLVVDNIKVFSSEMTLLTVEWPSEPPLPQKSQVW